MDEYKTKSLEEIREIYFNEEIIINGYTPTIAKKRSIERLVEYVEINRREMRIKNE